MLRVIKNSKTEHKIYTGPHQQLAFHACWSPSLINPVLNRLYKDSVCYTERWYLEVRRMINEEMWTHPLLVSVVKDSRLKTQIVKSTFIDGALMRNVINDNNLPEYQISASVNLKKLNRWCAFFVSLPDSIKILADLNGQSPD
jgi:hypothetical protein